MADGRRREQWKHTSAMMTNLVNVNRDPEKSPLPLDHFDPYKDGETKGGGIPLTVDTIHLLKAFVSGKKARRVSRAGPEHR